MTRPALFLDRDGIVNEEAGYLHRFEDVRWVDGIVPLLREANRLHYFVAVVTNQSGIARGYYSEEQFDLLMQQMRSALDAQGAHIHAVYYSPFHPEHGVGAYRKETDCRKPRPGMLVRAAKEHDLDLSSSIMVGDRCSDMATGEAAGLTRLFLLKGTEAAPCAITRYVEITRLTEVIAHLNRSNVSSTGG